MSKLEFTWKDFALEHYLSLEATERIAEIANRRLAEMLAAQPTITISGKELSVRFDALPEKFRARLVNVEKLDENGG